MQCGLQNHACVVASKKSSISRAKHSAVYLFILFICFFAFFVCVLCLFFIAAQSANQLSKHLLFSIFKSLFSA